jgi:2-oxoisovalerate dehydrogenase E2 component (dihydrolipoyl transacylase)
MTDFILPDIGEGIVECELLEWLVAEGDDIVEDQPVAEVMTDKATVQIPAMHSGKVTKLYYKAGDIAKVHAPLFAMQQQISEMSQALNSNSATQQADHTQASSPLVTSAVQASSVSSIDFILPDIGEGIVECELVKWLVSEGQVIVEDQPVVEVMTDKALVEIPAKHAGKVSRLYYAEGEIAKVHTPLFAIQIDTDLSQGSGNQGPMTRSEQSVHSSAQTPSAVATTTSETATVNEVEKPVSVGKALASPAVRRIAREKNIDLSRINGSGAKGRVLKEDLLEPNTVNSKSVSSNHTPAPSKGGKRTEAIRGIRAAMAKQMTHAALNIPHFMVSEEIHMDNLIAARAQLKDKFAQQGVKLSFMPFFIKALSLALKQFPIINSQVNADCTELTYLDDHNIGMAVDSKIGLVVPNIKGVQHLSLLDIAKQSNELVELARVGKLKSSDLKDGTITISNIGVLGGTVATPVINAPESAIVALGKMQRLPRFDDNDKVVAVNIMQVSWSGDHRIIDGATMVRFNNLWKSYLENPLTMFIE